MLKSQKVPKVTGPVKLLYELQSDAMGNVLWDYANREKAVTDLLVSHGVIEADHRLIVKEVTVRGTDQPVGIRITISPDVALAKETAAVEDA